MKTLVAIVDDDEFVISAWTRFLKSRKIESRGFNCGKELMDNIAAGEMPRVIVTDFNYTNLEIKTGADYCKEIKEKYPNIKVIGISGGELENLKKFKQARADIVYEKPIDFIGIILPQIQLYLEEDKRNCEEKNVVDDDALDDAYLSKARELNFDSETLAQREETRDRKI